jgi:hypothetical protein
MTDEEKKAVEVIKSDLAFCKSLRKRYRDEQQEKYYEIIINLIEKQSKEIEELKRENKEIREWKYVIDSPIDLKKLSELDLIKIFGKSYIAVDKIKAKIEELDDINSEFSQRIIFN